MAHNTHLLLYLLVLFVSLSHVQGRVISETEDESKHHDVRPFIPFVPLDLVNAAESIGKPKLPALLEGMEIEGGKISPEFDSNTFSYTVEPSGSIEDLEVVAKVHLRAGEGDGKYKVKTETKGLEKEQNARLDSQSQSAGDEELSVVEVHVSASNRESVIYYLNIGQIDEPPVRSALWTILFQIIFWAGVVIAAAVLAVFLYAIYLNYSAPAPNSENSFSNGGDYQRAGRGEGSSR